jgi:hypothetical protein
MVSMRLPVIGSTRRQYLASAAAAGAPAPWLGSGCDADTGEAAAIMLKAAINSLQAMSFLLGRDADIPLQRPKISFSFDRKRGRFDRHLTRSIKAGQDAAEAGTSARSSSNTYALRPLGIFPYGTGF